MKKISIVFIVLIIILVAGYMWNRYTNKTPVYTPPTAQSHKDATYTIGGQKVTLVNGRAETESAPGSSSKIVTQYFGNEVTHDFDNDGRTDVAFLLSQNTGGSGTFYYVVFALNTSAGYVGSEGLFLGDRIAPQTTNMGTGNIVIVNYADRKPGESFAVQPSVGKSIWVLLDQKTMQIGEVAQNFEGEADVNKMTLGMKTWNWIRTAYNDDTTVTPRIAQKFTLTFKSDKTFSATTDCNSVSGTYTLSGTSIVFSKMMSTLMACDKSQEQAFTKMLGQVQSYFFTSKGEMIFDLKLDTGTMTFR